MQRIQSGEKTAILLENPEDAKFCHHKGKLHSKVELPPDVEDIMRKRGTTFTKDSPNIMAVHCEREILKFLSHDHPELKDDVLVLSSMNGEGRQLWNQDNMLVLNDFVHAYIALSQQERMERNDWTACRRITDRFIKALKGNKQLKHSLISLFRNRFPGRPLTLEELERRKAAEAAHEARFNRKSRFSSPPEPKESTRMSRFGSLS